MDSYSPVSLAYFDRAPFKFNGTLAYDKDHLPEEMNTIIATWDDDHII